MAAVSGLGSLPKEQRSCLLSLKKNCVVSAALKALSFFISLIQGILFCAVYPFRIALAILRRCSLFRYMLLPFDWVVHKVFLLWDSFCYKIERAYSPHVKSSSSISDLQKTYMGLGQNKWKEWVEALVRPFGRRVFDDGSHGWDKEPGFDHSMVRATHYLSSRLGKWSLSELIQNLPEILLQTHRLAASHFLGCFTRTSAGPCLVGKFRSTGTSLCIPHTPGRLKYSENAAERANAFYNEIEKACGARVGSFIQVSKRKESCFEMKVNEVSSDKIKKAYTYVCQELGKDLQLAGINRRLKLEALCKFYQRSLWIHPPRDGSMRTNTAVFNFFLVELGFTPMLAEDFNYAYLRPVKELADEVEVLMKRWEWERRA